MNPWEAFLGSLGGFFIIPYLWFKGKSIEEKTEKAISYAGYIGLVIICVLILVVIALWSK